MRPATQSKPKQDIGSSSSTHHRANAHRNPDSTKRGFLIEEIRFLEEFKEQAQALKQLALPSGQPEPQLAKLLNKMQRTFTKDLSEEIVYIRRDVSFEKISDETGIQTRFAQNYEERIEEYSSKLERMESIVQETEDWKRKNKDRQMEGEKVMFKVVSSSSLLEESIRQRESVKKALRAKLALCGSLAKIWQREASQLTLSKQKHHKYETYHFLASHQKHYRNSSTSDRQQHSPDTADSQQRPKDKPRNLPHFYVKQLQQEIFQEELGRMRSHNNKLQLSISLFKAASVQREEEKILKDLSRKEQLEMEESVAREVFAYQKLMQRFEERL